MIFVKIAYHFSLDFLYLHQFLRFKPSINSLNTSLIFFHRFLIVSLRHITSCKSHSIFSSVKFRYHQFWWIRFSFVKWKSKQSKHINHTASCMTMLPSKFGQHNCRISSHTKYNIVYCNSSNYFFLHFYLGNTYNERNEQIDTKGKQIELWIIVGINIHHNHLASMMMDLQLYSSLSSSTRSIVFFNIISSK